MKAELSTLAGLSREERRILRQAWLSLLLADAALRLSSLPKVQRLLARPARPASASAGSTPPARLAKLVDAAARHHVRRMGCLQKSLVLQSLLHHHHGMAADLQIGVRRHAGTLRAHAWLERAGQPLFETPEVGSAFPALQRREAAR